MFRKMFFSFVLMFAVAGAYTVYAQEVPPAQQSPALQQESPDVNISDQELESFVKAAVKVDELQKESEGEMVKAIQDEGLEPNRFVEINTIQQNPAADTENSVSEKELDNYNKAMKEVQSIQKGVQTEQVKVIEQEGLDVGRYVQIAKAVQQDPGLMKKVQDMQKN
jgi:FKBP-type peptidyl-prolyl cis-trans isomerase